MGYQHHGVSAQKCPGDDSCHIYIHTIQAWCIVMLSKISFTIYIFVLPEELVKMIQFDMANWWNSANLRARGERLRASHWMPRGKHFLAHLQLQRSLHFLRSRLKKLPKAKKIIKTSSFHVRSFGSSNYWSYRMIVYGIFLLMFMIKIQPHESKDFSI